MSAMRSFRDLPLWVKVLVAPAACLTTGAIVAASIWLGAMQTEARLAEVMRRFAERFREREAERRGGYDPDQGYACLGLAAGRRSGRGD